MSDTDADPYDYEYEYQPFGKSGSSYQDEQQDSPAQPSAPASGDNDDDDLKVKAMELARREADLEHREAIVESKESAYKDGSLRVKNWPKCKPILDMSYSEIPMGLRKVATWISYLTWYASGLLLFLNFFTSLVILFTPITKSNGIPDILDRCTYVLFAFLHMIGGFLVSFGIYWSYYKAMRHVNIPRFCVAFVTSILPVLYCCAGVSGNNAWGFSGIIVAIRYIPSGVENNWTGFIPSLLMIFLWAIFAVIYTGLFISLILVFRKERHSWKQVQKYAKDTGANLIVSGVTNLATRVGKFAEDSPAPLNDQQEIEEDEATNHGDYDAV